jgi:hypothetical protein
MVAEIWRFSLASICFWGAKNFRDAAMKNLPSSPHNIIVDWLSDGPLLSIVNLRDIQGYCI